MVGVIAFDAMVVVAEPIVPFVTRVRVIVSPVLHTRCLHYHSL